MHANVKLSLISSQCSRDSRRCGTATSRAMCPTFTVVSRLENYYPSHQRHPVAIYLPLHPTQLCVPLFFSPEGAWLPLNEVRQPIPRHASCPTTASPLIWRRCARAVGGDPVHTEEVPNANPATSHFSRRRHGHSLLLFCLYSSPI